MTDTTKPESKYPSTLRGRGVQLNARCTREAFFRAVDSLEVWQRNKPPSIYSGGVHTPTESSRRCWYFVGMGLIASETLRLPGRKHQCFPQRKQLGRLAGCKQPPARNHHFTITLGVFVRSLTFIPCRMRSSASTSTVSKGTDKLCRMFTRVPL